MSFFMSPQPMGVQFDPNASEYRTCCGSFHVRIAAAMIAVLEAVILVANFIASIAVPQMGGEFGPSYQGSQYLGPILSFIFPMIALALLFLGLKYDSSSYLLAHLALRLAAIVFLLTGCVIAIIVMAKGPENYTATLGLTNVAAKYPTSVHQSLTIAVGAILAVFLITFLCYHFFYNANLYGPTAYYNGGYNGNGGGQQQLPPVPSHKKSSTVDRLGGGPQYGGLAGPQIAQMQPAYPTRVGYPVGQQRGYYYQ